MNISTSFDLSTIGTLKRTARRSIMPSGRWALDNETIHMATRLFGKCQGKSGGSDDPQELRSF